MNKVVSKPHLGLPCKREGCWDDEEDKALTWKLTIPSIDFSIN